MEESSSLTLSELMERYNKIVEGALKLNFLVRDSELQKEKVMELERFRLLLKVIKDQAIQRQQEEVANLIFQGQCVVNALKSALCMWGELKSHSPDIAWNLLVDAQEYTSVALRIPVRGSWGISDFATRLFDIERIVFPGWPFFLSPGIIEEGAGLCSICRNPYNDCQEHIEGYVYWGQLCERIARKFVEANHSAFVEKPKDKRCIIRYVATDDGRKKDYITWRILDESFAKYDGDENHLLVEGIVLTTRRLDFD